MEGKSITELTDEEFRNRFDQALEPVQEYLEEKTGKRLEDF